VLEADAESGRLGGGDDDTADSQTSPRELDSAFYVARVIAVELAKRDSFVSYMRGTQLPIWSTLKRKGYLSAQSVFEVDTVLTSAAGVPRWNFLLLPRIAPGVDAGQFLQAEQEAGGVLGAASSSKPRAPFDVKRVEVLRSTPNSYYPVPAGRYRSREADARYVIEYIGVRDEPSALNQYREATRVSIGPAVGELVRAARQFNFIALETVAVQSTGPGMPKWNQIHVNGYLPDASGGSGDDFDAALRGVNPAAGGRDSVFGRLGAIRVKPREDVTHLVPERGLR
jgi:hypothetical protein